MGKIVAAQKRKFSIRNMTEMKDNSSRNKKNKWTKVLKEDFEKLLKFKIEN